VLEGGIEPKTPTSASRPGPAAPEFREASCCGVRIAACSFDDAVSAVISLPAEIRGGDAGAAIHLCNAYTLALADRNNRLKTTLNTARYNFPDGWPVARLTKQRTRLADSAKVSGPDLFHAVLSAGRDHDTKHYFLGSTPETLAALERSVRRDFPGIEIVGVESPPFRELTADERAEQRQRIIDSGADLVWVGLGTPKQDWAVEKFAADTPAVFLAVGAAFDFLAGLKPRAPEWMGKYGVEWIFRLVSEPKRLWRRYLIGNPQFIASVLRNHGH
jgi:N-acetylglucosaminyldiphosphoundecaprenol N-acetyl-beta-D-mannosaminyltransferase